MKLSTLLLVQEGGGPPPRSVVWCNAGRRTEESGECRENVLMGLPGLDLAVVCGNAYPNGSFLKYS